MNDPGVLDKPQREDNSCLDIVFVLDDDLLLGDNVKEDVGRLCIEEVDVSPTLLPFVDLPHILPYVCAPELPLATKVSELLPLEKSANVCSSDLLAVRSSLGMSVNGQ
mmetsp:Transcript_4055/g.8568  ORF Transcript_4055/g.8568 Transcript_4055/m.8568 type:complete len:108 (+) Transcript_4055:2521-2844(+)